MSEIQVNLNIPAPGWKLVPVRQTGAMTSVSRRNSVSANGFWRDILDLVPTINTYALVSMGCAWEKCPHGDGCVHAAEKVMVAVDQHTGEVDMEVRYQWVPLALSEDMISAFYDSRSAHWEDMLERAPKHVEPAEEARGD